MSPLKRYLVAAVLAGSLTASGNAAAPNKVSAALQLRQDVTEFVACLLKRERPLMATYIFERRGEKLNMLRSPCFANAGEGRLNRAGVNIDGDLWVGIASELLLREVDLEAVDPLLPNAPAIDQGELMTVEKMSPKSKKSASEKVVWVADVNRKRSLNMLGECLVRKNPSLARQVFLSDYGSDEEGEALKKLAPARAECSSIEVSILDPRNLRIYLASNYALLAGLADPSFKEKLL